MTVQPKHGPFPSQKITQWSLQADPINHTPALCVESPVFPFSSSNPSAAVFHQAGPPYHRWSFHSTLHHILHHLRLKMPFSESRPTLPPLHTLDLPMPNTRRTLFHEPYELDEQSVRGPGSCSIHAVLNGHYVESFIFICYARTMAAAASPRFHILLDVITNPFPLALGLLDVIIDAAPTVVPSRSHFS